jgi:hypothetical protein
LPNANLAFFRALTLALQLEATASVAGRRHVLRKLTRDPGPGSGQHCQVQLELATLALSQGWSVGLEERLAEDAPPVDVVVRRNSASIPIEVKVVLASQHNTAALDEARGFDEIVFRLLAMDVHVSGEFPAVPNERGRAALWSTLEPVANLVSEHRKAQEVEWEGARLRLSHASALDDRDSLQMAMPLRDDRERLPGKLSLTSIQAETSGARWLCLQAFDGYLRFSRGWDLPLTQRLEFIVGDLLDATCGTKFDGVVLTSGLRMSVNGEAVTANRESGATGLFRQVTPMHGRISVMLPLTGSGRSEADLLARLYASESEWFESAVVRAGLPSIEVIMGGDTGGS